jgi:hypothetical protein
MLEVVEVLGPSGFPLRRAELVEAEDADDDALIPPVDVVVDPVAPGDIEWNGAERADEVDSIGRPAELDDEILLEQVDEN